MKLDLYSISEEKPGQKWKELFKRHWLWYKSWYLANTKAQSPDLKTCRKQLKKHMPEFYPTYLRLCKVVGKDMVAHRFLTGYCPPAYISGCAQIVLEKEAQLVRNYDFDPLLSEGTLLRSKWNNRVVIAMGDSLIGVLDGMNSDGLVVSLTFGGRKAVGEGFGIPFILRYILETYSDLDEATAALMRIPSHMSYNVMLMNSDGEHRLVQVAPDLAPVVTNLSASANHQGLVDWQEHAVFSNTIERELYLHDMLAQRSRSANQITDEFLKAPLFNCKYTLGFGTIYTSVYKAKTGVVELRWPGVKLKQSFKKFNEGITSINYKETVPPATSIASLQDQLQVDYNGAIEAYWLEYGRSWVNKDHAAMVEFLSSAESEPLKRISERIRELLVQMEGLPVAD
ncbi:MAG: putative choloylglycine hydrolase [Flavobacteriales bacterium]